MSEWDDYKKEIGDKLNIDINHSENLSCSECGKVGGKAAGKIGGEMVRRMIKAYEDKNLR